MKKNLPTLITLGATVAALLPTNVRAVNILVNPGFEANNGHVVAAGWTYFSPPVFPHYFGDYWVESAVTPHSGSYYWKQWGALYSPTTNNVAGIYQDFSSAPGSTYTASGWFYTHSTDVLGTDCYVWIEVDFYGASSNLLALYKSAPFNAAVGLDTWFQYQVTNACDITMPVSTGDPYFNTYAVTGSVSQLVAPIGTATVRYRFAYLQYLSEGGSAYLDDAALDQTVAPFITRLTPLTQTGEAGSTVQFFGRAEGREPLAYQWFFNGSTPVAGGTGSALQLSGLDLSQAGAYTLVVTNIFGAVTSSPAILSVIASVQRQIVPGLTLSGANGVSLQLDNTSELGAQVNWLLLDMVILTNPPQYYFDVSANEGQRFYRAWHTDASAAPPTLDLHMVPAITITGAVGNSVRVDCINQFGPTDAWVTLATVTLTNTSQLYFDTSMIGQPPRLYRLFPQP